MKDQSGTEKDLARVKKRRNCDGMDWSRKPRKNSLAEVGGMLSHVRSISQDNFQVVQSDLSKPDAQAKVVRHQNLRLRVRLEWPV